MENQNIKNLEEKLENFSEEKKIERNGKKEKAKTSLEMRIIGWAGSLLIITAYSLNSLGHLDSQNTIYPILNLAGAFFMGIRVFANRNWSNFFLEIFWAAIAVVSLVKIISQASSGLFSF